MAKITRKTQKVFGSSAGTNEIAKFGSLAAGAPVRYTGAAADPDLIQSLTEFLEGWHAAILAGDSPALEDRNALDWLFARQLAYLYQQGIAEWDSATTYYIGSMVNSAGYIYVSITNDNLNNAVTDTANWKAFSSSSNVVTLDPSTDSPYTLTSADNGKMFLIESSAGAMVFNLQASPTLNFTFSVKDVDGSFSTNNCTLNRNGAESIEGLAVDYTLDADFGAWSFITDATDWYIGA